MLVPRPPPLIDTGWDKLNHLLAFAGPTFAGLAALRRHRWAPVCWLLLGLLAWGAGMELAQGMLPPRTASLADLLADALGMMMGAGFYALAWRWIRTAPT
jgi:VanZ family protein